MTAIQFSERSSMEEMESCVPPGFRFRPTEEELVGYYLKRKINSLKINLDVIVELDLYKMEPWDLQDRCKLGYKEQNEWYFFSHKDKKYPTGTRTNRATAAGFWKATGRDKAVMSKNRMIGMRKTLVFYKGRAPNGCKTDWIMHEYRLQTSDHAPHQEEGWVVCRAFRKPSPSHHQRQLGFEAQYCYFREQISHARPLSSFADDHHLLLHHPGEGTSFSDQPFQQQFMCNHTELIELPQPDDHSPSTACTQNNNIGLSSNEEYYSEERSNEWQSLDSLFASNLTDTVNFFGHSNLPMIPYSHELVQPPQIQASHILGYFPDS